MSEQETSPQRILGRRAERRANNIADVRQQMPDYFQGSVYEQYDAWLSTTVSNGMQAVIGQPIPREQLQDTVGQIISPIDRDFLYGLMRQQAGNEQGFFDQSKLPSISQSTGIAYLLRQEIADLTELKNPLQRAFNKQVREHLARLNNLAAYFTEHETHFISKETQSSTSKPLLRPKVTRVLEETKEFHFQEALDDMSSMLDRNPSLLRNNSFVRYTPNAYGRLSEIRGYIQREGNVIKGADFLPLQKLSIEQEVWLGEHPAVNRFPREYSDKNLRGGRLATVVASHPQREEITEVIEESGYSPHVWSNIDPHVSRLLTIQNSESCYQFALAVIRNQQYSSHVPTSADGNNAAQFWTYGPYVLEALGGNYERFITEWADQRIIVKTRNLDDASYPGIEDMYFHDSGDINYLGSNGTSSGHQVARLIAQKAILPTLDKMKAYPAIRVNYPASNDMLYPFIETVGKDYMHEKGDLQQIPKMMGIIYDLGHPGRGYESFLEADLAIPSLEMVRNRKVDDVVHTEMPLSSFFTQLAIAIENYMTMEQDKLRASLGSQLSRVERALTEDNISGFDIRKSELRALQELADYEENKKIALTLRLNRTGAYTLAKQPDLIEKTEK